MDDWECEIPPEHIAATERTYEALLADIRQRVGESAVRLLFRLDEGPFPRGISEWAEYGTEVALRWSTGAGRFHELRVDQLTVDRSEISWRWSDVDTSGRLVSGEAPYDPEAFARRLSAFLSEGAGG